LQRGGSEIARWADDQLGDDFVRRLILREVQNDDLFAFGCANDLLGPRQLNGGKARDRFLLRIDDLLGLNFSRRKKLLRENAGLSARAKISGFDLHDRTSVVLLRKLQTGG
jgi:hypothetical protein